MAPAASLYFFSPWSALPSSNSDSVVLGSGSGKCASCATARDSRAYPSFVSGLFFLCDALSLEELQQVVGSAGF